MDKNCERVTREIIEGFKECRRAFTAIGDETRQLILISLIKNDSAGVRVGEISAKTHLTRPSVSHHLKILKDAKIVSVKKDGTKNYYYIDIDEVLWGNIFSFITLIHNDCKFAIN